MNKTELAKRFKETAARLEKHGIQHIDCDMKTHEDCLDVINAALDSAEELEILKKKHKKLPACPRCNSTLKEVGISNLQECYVTCVATIYDGELEYQGDPIIESLDGLNQMTCNACGHHLGEWDEERAFKILTGKGD